MLHSIHLREEKKYREIDTRKTNSNETRKDVNDRETKTAFLKKMAKTARKKKK